MFSCSQERLGAPNFYSDLLERTGFGMVISGSAARKGKNKGIGMRKEGFEEDSSSLKCACLSLHNLNGAFL